MSNKYIIVPEDILTNNSLQMGARLLYGDILSLCKKEGFCWASNAHFVARYGVSMRTISRWIVDMERAGVVSCEVRNNNERTIVPLVLIAFDEENAPADAAGVTPMTQTGDGDD